MHAKEIKQAVREISNYEPKSVKELQDLVRVDAIKLQDRWVESKFTDFDVYSDKQAISFLIEGYLIVSRLAIKNTIHFANNGHKIKSVFDDYNGAGFTTIDLCKHFNSVEYYNDMDRQVEMLNKMIELFKNDLKCKPVRKDARDKKYDLVCSFEVCEHYKKPIEYIDEIANLVKPNGYLSFTTTFSLAEVCVGHFTEYEVNSEILNAKRTSRKVRKRLLEHFDIDTKYWNGKPVIYKKKAK